MILIIKKSEIGKIENISVDKAKEIISPDFVDVLVKNNKDCEFYKYKEYVLIYKNKHLFDLFMNEKYSFSLKLENNFKAYGDGDLRIYNYFFDYDKIVDLKKRNYDYFFIVLDDSKDVVYVKLSLSDIPIQIKDQHFMFIDIINKIMSTLSFNVSDISINDNEIVLSYKHKTPRIRI